MILLIFSISNDFFLTLSGPFSLQPCPICYHLRLFEPTKSVVKIFFSCETDDSQDNYSANIQEIHRRNEKLKEIIVKQEEMLSEIQREMSKSRKPTVKKAKEIKSRIAEIENFASDI